MFPSSSFLVTAFFTLSIVSSSVIIDRSPITLPIARRLSLTGSANILRKDQARAAALRAKAQASKSGVHQTRGVFSETIINGNGAYGAVVGIGDPPTYYNLLIDTGSANTWIGAGKPYVRTSTSTPTGLPVDITYGSVWFFGDEYIDQVTLADGLVIKNQSIGVAQYVEGFEGWDGMLGLGPVGLTLDTVDYNGALAVPTVSNNLKAQGTIETEVIGISFNPASLQNVPVVNGTLTWGGIDSTQYTSEITYVPFTTNIWSTRYWGIDLSISYGALPIMQEASAIVDTGTTFTLIASDAFQWYRYIIGAYEDVNTGLWTITPDQYSNLRSLYFNIGGTTFELTPNAQIWPRALNAAIGGNASVIYLAVNDIGAFCCEYTAAVLGYTFLERYYSVYDTTNKRVGFAETWHTWSTAN